MPKPKASPSIKELEARAERIRKNTVKTVEELEILKEQIRLFHERQKTRRQAKPYKTGK
jgi:hypothetical protein